MTIRDLLDTVHARLLDDYAHVPDGDPVPFEEAKHVQVGLAVPLRVPTRNDHAREATAADVAAIQSRATQLAGEVFAGREETR